MLAAGKVREQHLYFRQICRLPGQRGSDIARMSLASSRLAETRGSGWRVQSHDMITAHCF